MPQPPSVAPTATPGSRPVLALLLPLAALALQWILSPWIGQRIWYMGFIGVFIACWIGDRRSGVLAAVIATAGVWLLFVPPRWAVVKATTEAVPALIFFGTCLLFVYFHERFRRTADRLRRAVDDSRIYAAFLANSSDCIGIAEPDGTPVYMNSAGRRMVGLAPDFPVQRTTILDYYPPEQRAFAAAVILKAMREEGHWQGDTFLRHWQTQQPIPVSDTHFEIRDPDGDRLLGFGAVIRDMSVIRRAQEELELSNRRLAQANSEIVQLYERVSRLDELKTRLFSNVSHELRTPLTLMLGPLEKHLLSSGLPDELRRDLEVVHRNAQTVLRHVTDLLDVARVEAGRLDVDYAEADAAALVRRVADHFTAKATEQALQFIVTTPQELRLETDAHMLERIVLNLLSNAFKFAPPGGCIRVSVRRAGECCRVEVADSGPGVPPDQRKAVFDRFSQLENPAARQAGTGLGLSIVREFTLLLGGSVAIEDADEGGALFVVEIPLAAPPGTAVRPEAVHRPEPVRAAAVDAARAAPAGGTVTAPAGGGAGRVLVVEDNDDMNQFLADTLRRGGFEVRSAFDGGEGYSMAVTEPPDLVLTDVRMPDVSGAELVHQLRERPDLASTPIVVLTAMVDEDLRVRLLNAGVQDYLSKPFSSAELLVRVRNLVERKRTEERVARLQGQLEAVTAATLEISEAVAGVPEESVRAVFQTIALSAQRLTGAEYAAAGLGGDGARPFEIWAVAGLPPERAADIGSPPRQVGVLRFVTEENRVVRLRDVRQHPRFRGWPAGHPVMTSFLAVPIRYHGHPVGNLYLANKRSAPEFTDDDQQVVEMLAVRAGSAVETARLYAAEGRAHAWLQSVIDQMPEGIILMDADGHVTMANRSLDTLAHPDTAAVDRFGNPMTVDLRRPSGEPVSPDDLPIVKALVKGETIWADELIGRRTDDRLVPLLVSAAPIITPEGRVGGAAMVLQDVSALKELERLREEWATIVAHDLRQPIGVIALRSSALLQGELTEEQRQDVRQIGASAQRLSRMTSDLLDASLLDTRRIRLEPERLELVPFLRDVVGRMPQVEPRLRIAAAEPVIVTADPHRLEQVVVNLLSNAAKYGAPGTDIGLSVAASTGHVEVRVANHGPGIAPEELPLLFDRFVRTRAARVSRTAGLGLGLYIARGLVEAHGGRLWVDSTPGDLTTFHFTLPRDAHAD